MIQTNYISTLFLKVNITFSLDNNFTDLLHIPTYLANKFTKIFYLYYKNLILLLKS